MVSEKKTQGSSGVALFFWHQGMGKQLQVSVVATRLATYLGLLSASQFFGGKGVSFQVVITDSHYLGKN